MGLLGSVLFGFGSVCLPQVKSLCVSLSCLLPFSLLSLSLAFLFFLSLMHFPSFSLSCISLLSLSLAFLFFLSLLHFSFVFFHFPLSLSLASLPRRCVRICLFLALCVRACGRAVEEPSCRHTPKTLLLTSIFVLSFPVKYKSKRHFHTPKKNG